MNTDALIGSEAAAEILGWSKAKVNRRAAAGKLPVALKLPGRTGAYLFNKATIEFLAEQTGKRVAA